MSDYNNNNRNQNQFSFNNKSGFGNGGTPWKQNNGGFAQNFQQNQQRKPKRSGAVYSRIKKGKMEGMTCVNAWRRTKNGLMTASAFPVDGVEHIGGEKKNIFIRYAVEVRVADLGTSQTYWCVMQKESRRIVIKELGMFITPNGSGTTGTGKRVSGYFGKFVK